MERMQEHFIVAEGPMNEEYTVEIGRRTVRHLLKNMFTFKNQRDGASLEVAPSKSAAFENLKPERTVRTRFWPPGGPSTWPHA